MATPLSIIQTACQRMALSVPTYLIGLTEQNVIQMLSLLEETGKDMATRYPWTALQNEGNYTTLAVEDQGAISTIAPGLNYIVNDTIWNRTLRRPVFGPKTQQGWQQQKAFAINGPWSSYRIKGGHLFEYPVPVAGQSCYFEYITNYWITDVSGVTGKTSFSANADLVVLDDSLLTMGLIWRFKQAKGFEYSEDFNKFERAFMDAAARDGGKDTLNLTNTMYDISPGIVVPSGSWNL